MTHHQERILKLLDENEIQFTSLHHEETRTSADSARVRGVDLSTGGKALVLKVRNDNDSSGSDHDHDDHGDGDDDDDKNNGFALFIVSAVRQLNTKKIKKEFQVKDVRFATKEELAALTGGLVPGSVPPFGRPILNLDLYVDTSIAENEIIAFNCGSLTDSIIMSVKDYLAVAAPTKVFAFSK